MTEADASSWETSRLPAPDIAATPVAAEIPAQSTLDEQLKVQRLRLLEAYSVGLGAVGGMWAVAYVVYLLRTPSVGLGQWVVAGHVGLLAASGGVGLGLCRSGLLRAATYTLVLPLMLMATVNLALISNAEGCAVMTYCVGIGLAALTVEGRELLRLAALSTASALVGALLHLAPPIGPVVLPPPLAAASLLLAVTLGLAYPSGLFWLFSSNLTASRSEAWDQARRAAEASRVIAERTGQLEAKNRELSDFLYVVSHDLRAPLINLEGFSRALQESMATIEELMPKHSHNGNGHGNGNGSSLGGLRDAWPTLSEDMNESLDFILRGVAKMDFLVRGLLELSRIDSRANDRRSVNLNSTVDDVLGSLHFRICERRIQVQVEPLPTVQGDPVRLSQVFSNLIDNAIKYMKPDGAAEIHVGCRTNGAAHHFFVRDTGIGIRAEDQSKVFRLFTRIQVNDAPGEGLGLTAVKKIVEKHQGRIWVESEIGEGSTFWFTLPKEIGPERSGDDATAGAH